MFAHLKQSIRVNKYPSKKCIRLLPHREAAFFFSKKYKQQIPHPMRTAKVPFPHG